MCNVQSSMCPFFIEIAWLHNIICKRKWNLQDRFRTITSKRRPNNVFLFNITKYLGIVIVLMCKLSFSTKLIIRTMIFSYLYFWYYLIQLNKSKCNLCVVWNSCHIRKSDSHLKLTVIYHAIVDLYPKRKIHSDVFCLTFKVWW